MNVKELIANLKKFQHDLTIVTIADSTFMGIPHTKITNIDVVEGTNNVPVLMLSGAMQCYRDTTEAGRLIEMLRKENKCLKETIAASLEVKDPRTSFELDDPHP